MKYYFHQTIILRGPRWEFHPPTSLTPLYFSRKVYLIRTCSYLGCPSSNRQFSWYFTFNVLFHNQPLLTSFGSLLQIRISPSKDILVFPSKVLCLYRIQCQIRTMCLLSLCKIFYKRSSERKDNLCCCELLQSSVGIDKQFF